MTTRVFGCELEPLPANYVALGVVVMVKCLDDDGDLTLIQRVSTDLSAWEAVGMAVSSADLLRQGLSAAFEPSDEGDD